MDSSISNYSLVDFYNPDGEKQPLFDKVKGKMHATIEEGDILFIPAYWWHHVRSSSERNIAVNYWYTPNYMFYLFNSGLEDKQFK